MYTCIKITKKNQTNKQSEGLLLPELWLTKYSEKASNTSARILDKLQLSFLNAYLSSQERTGIMYQTDKHKEGAETREV